ncbi:MAG TPA: flagellar filament capping protein FliD [Candidatus Baltobacteraceae bacterium]|nr:flagellar filament capping protein FliD [Candidatus Baltobacteraceae bacterium]
MSTSNSASVYGTNVPPITFPGIVSGIDWDSVIDKLTQLQLAPEGQLNAQIATLNNANTALIQINNLLTSVQNALADLSNPDLFTTYEAESSDLNALTASGIPGVSSAPGLYTIESTQAATNTSILSSLSAGHSITDDLTSGPYAGQASDTVPLIDSYARVTPTDGTNGEGEVTVDGVQIAYNVNTQSLDTILNNITTEVRAGADAQFLATLVNGVVQFSSTDESISLGSSSDQGNLLNVLQLSSAQLINSGGSGGSITGTANVGGINPYESFDSSNSAGFVKPVTAGTFTINGVKITVSADESLNDVINAINSSTAGVTASYNTITGQVELVNANSGPQSIILSASGDTSNFLSAVGLTTTSGATTTVGQQSVVKILNADGTTSTYYNDSNTVTNAIPGLSLSITGNTTTPFTLNVSQNTALLVSALQGFVSTYNAAVNEINSDTAPPVVQAIQPGSGAIAQSIPGGVLYGNSDAQSIVQELENIVGGFLGSGTTYNSLSQIGLQLDSSFDTIAPTSVDSQTPDGSLYQTQTIQGTDGQLQPLSVSAFLAAYQADPNAVQNLIVGANSLTTQLGSYLTSVTGNPTLLNSGTVGNIPSVSLIQNYENSNDDTITNLQQQVQQITDAANQYADTLRSEYTGDEATIAGLQAEQQELAAVFGFSTSSTSSSSSS